MAKISVKLNGISDFGRLWSNRMGNPWNVCKITDHVLFSSDPGPWMLLERDHFQRWVNMKSDRNFLVRWGGWTGH